MRCVERGEFAFLCFTEKTGGIERDNFRMQKDSFYMKTKDTKSFRGILQ